MVVAHENSLSYDTKINGIAYKIRSDASQRQWRQLPPLPMVFALVPFEMFQ